MRSSREAIQQTVQLGFEVAAAFAVVRDVGEDVSLAEAGIPEVGELAA